MNKHIITQLGGKQITISPPVILKIVLEQQIAIAHIIDVENDVATYSIMVFRYQPGAIIMKNGNFKLSSPSRAKYFQFGFPDAKKEMLNLIFGPFK